MLITKLVDNYKLVLNNSINLSLGLKDCITPLVS